MRLVESYPATIAHNVGRSLQQDRQAMLSGRVGDCGDSSLQVCGELGRKKALEFSGVRRGAKPRWRFGP